MIIHKNARLTPIRREEMARKVQSGELSKSAASRVYGVSVKIVSCWVSRFATEGHSGMVDRSSRPKRLHRLTAPSVVERIVALRRHRLTGKRIALETKGEITLDALVVALQEEQGILASRVTAWRALKFLGLSHKKTAESPRAKAQRRSGSAPPLDQRALGLYGPAPGTAGVYRQDLGEVQHGQDHRLGGPWAAVG